MSYNAKDVTVTVNGEPVEPMDVPEKAVSYFGNVLEITGDIEVSEVYVNGVKFSKDISEQQEV